jgi:UDP-2,3-diacylglucosamine pyrophosphatase LpxH
LAPKYYFVSDLHMGGDGELQHCDYAAEFIAFLKELETESPDTELLIVGDTFGFWELTLVHGAEKFEHIVRAHQAIFDQLRATAARIKVTMMVGNHDYELACDPAYADKLRAYNIRLDTSLVLIRTVGDRKIWIEHGQQRDEFNAFSDYGNIYALPVGYFITETFVSGASRHSDFGRGDWLKDIRSVGTMQIPDWILSNYFYREMGHGARPDLDSQEPYLRGAQEVFKSDDKVAVFVFGHTHAAFLQRLGPAGQVVLNTGTWLKLLHRVPVRFGLLPAVYYPSYRLNYFCIEQEDNRIVINYVSVTKTPERELTWLQRLMTLGKAPRRQDAIPARTIVEFQGTS